jgi:hypothetical protein
MKAVWKGGLAGKCIYVFKLPTPQREGIPVPTICDRVCFHVVHRQALEVGVAPGFQVLIHGPCKCNPRRTFHRCLPVEMVHNVYDEVGFPEGAAKICCVVFFDHVIVVTTFNAFHAIVVLGGGGLSVTPIVRDGMCAVIHKFKLFVAIVWDYA